MASVKTEIKRNPIKRRTRGYFSRFIRDGVNGDDTGLTLAKAGFIVAGVTTVATLAVFAPYILIAGLAFTLIYVGVGIKDEYDRNKAEDEKFQVLADLEDNEKFKSIEFKKTLKKQELLEISESSTISEQFLLKKLLHIYLEKLQVNSIEKAQEARNKKRKATGRLPNELKIIRHIEQATGFKSTEKDFGSKVYAYLNNASNDAEKQNDFSDQVMHLLGYEYDPKYQLATSLKAKRSRRSRASSVIKHISTFFWKANQGMGVVIGPAILLGIMVVGLSLAFTWPVVVVAGAVGLVAGGAALYYSRVVDKKYQQNTANLDKEIKSKKTKLALLNRISKVSQKTYRYDSSNLESNYTRFQEQEIPQLTFTQKIGQVLKPDIIAQTIYGMGIGALVGMAIVGTVLLIAATLLPPVGIPLIAATLPAVILGSAYMLRVGYTFGKDAYKKEQQRQKTVQEANIKMNRYYNDYVKNEKPLIKLEEEEKDNSKEIYDIERSPAEIFYSGQKKYSAILNLMIEYARYNTTMTELIKEKQTAGENPGHLLADSASQRAKTLEMIENTIGVKRSEEDPLSFYNHLSLFLQKDPQGFNQDQKVEAFRLRMEDKEKIKGKINGKSVEKSLGGKIGEALKSGKVNRFFRDHIFGILATASIALPLGFLLFGPGALPLIGIAAALITTAFIVHKVYEHKAKKQLKEAKNVDVTLPIMEKTLKLRDKTQSLARELDESRDKSAKQTNSSPIEIEVNNDKDSIETWTEEKRKTPPSNVLRFPLSSSQEGREDIKKSATHCAQEAETGTDKRPNILCEV